jgi:hypothetical protein
MIAFNVNYVQPQSKAVPYASPTFRVYNANQCISSTILKNVKFVLKLWKAVYFVLMDNNAYHAAQTSTLTKPPIYVSHALICLAALYVRAAPNASFAIVDTFLTTKIAVSAV